MSTNQTPCIDRVLFAELMKNRRNSDSLGLPVLADLLALGQEYLRKRHNERRKAGKQESPRDEMVRFNPHQDLR